MATRANRSAAAGRQARDAAAGGGFVSDVQDLWRLVVAYFKQETIEPIKGLGRYVGYGLAGSLAVGLGGLLVVLGILRLLQTVDAFDGNWSFVPYGITLVAAAGATGAAVKAGSRDRKKAKA